MAQLKNTTVTETGFVKLPVGSTAQRVASTLGEIRYNNESGNIEGYAASGWHTLSPINLVVTSVTPAVGFIDATSSTKIINPLVNAIFLINGFNFTPSCTVKLDNFTVPSGKVTVNNPELITIQTGVSGMTSGSYSNITVTDSHGKSSTFAYPITIQGGPVFTNNTNIATVTEGTISFTAAATSPGSSSMVYAANAVSGNGGSGYGLPAGLSINSSTGVVSGSLSLYGKQTRVYNITLKATDSNSVATSKDFILTLTNSAVPVITSPAQGSVGTLYLNPLAETPGATAINTPLGIVAPTSTTISTITATTVTGTTIRYSISSGSLPAGVTLNSSTGVISGTYQYGAKQPASQQYDFRVVATDALDNSSLEAGYSITVNTPYYFRQILTTGYGLGGYKSTTPWKNVGRLIMSTEIAQNLGDQLTYAHNYHGGACSADKQYTMGVANSTSHQVPGTVTLIYNMRTEICTTGYTSAYTRGAATVWSGNDGYQAAAYTAGGFQGANSNSIEKMPYSTETQSIIAATLNSTTNWYQGISGSCETFAALSGGSGQWDGATATTQIFTYATDTVSSWGAAGDLTTSPQDKVLSSKVGRVYGGTGTGTPGSTNLRKTVWADLQQVVIPNGYGNSAEQNYIMGQDRGWSFGLYTGAVQVNDSFRVIYAIDTVTAANTGTARIGVTGSSSSTTGWRD